MRHSQRIDTLRQITHSKCPAFQPINYGSFHMRARALTNRFGALHTHIRYAPDWLRVCWPTEHASDFALFLWRTQIAAAHRATHNASEFVRIILICHQLLLFVSSRPYAIRLSCGYDGHAVATFERSTRLAKSKAQQQQQQQPSHPNNFIFQLKLNVDTDWKRLAAAKATNSFNVYYG